MVIGMAAATSLPVDVLAFVFKSFSTHALLRAVSKVCKRWRVAALRAVTAFHGFNGDKITFVLSLLPCLMHLTLCCKPSCAIVLPPRLTSLELGSTLTFTGTLPALTYLSITGLEAPLSQGIDLLIAAKETLSSFVFEFGTYDKEALEYLATTRFHSLTSLTLILPSARGAYLSEEDYVFNFLVTHSAQLTSLELAEAHNLLSLTKRIAELSFPRLIMIDVEQLPASITVTLLKNAPSACWKRKFAVPNEFTPSQLTSLTELWLPVGASEWYESLPQLHRLALRHSETRVAVTPAMTSRVHFWAGPVVVPYLTRLKSLSLENVTGQLPSVVCLPHLKSLRIDHSVDAKSALEFVLLVLSSSTQLEEINLSILNGVNRQQLSQTAKAAEETGVKQMSIMVPQDEIEKLETLQQSFLWMKLSIIGSRDSR